VSLIYLTQHRTTSLKIFRWSSASLKVHLLEDPRRRRLLRHKPKLQVVDEAVDPSMEKVGRIRNQYVYDNLNVTAFLPFNPWIYPNSQDLFCLIQNTNLQDKLNILTSISAQI
jgi:hypothetical protein